MKTKDIKQNKGFTLVETMVAISILMLAILGPLTIASTGLRNAIFARDQITAYYLAQEGIEYVRYVRDNQYIKSVQQDDSSLKWSFSASGGLTSCVETSNGCGIDMPAFFGLHSSAIVIACSNPSSPNITGCGVLRKDANGFYTYSTAAGTSPTAFRRAVKISRVTTDEEIKVESIVEWQTNNVRKNFTITEHIKNIY